VSELIANVQHWFSAQIYNKMRKVDKKNSRVLTGAADQQSKNHILQKELYLHNATGQTNQQQSLLRSCSFSALREAACGVH
jgi:tRNA1(Val) A37 N6-methylase TrmN6